MPLVQTQDIVAQARGRGGGVPAFNVITLEHAEGIVEGADRAGRPVVLQLSENAVRYHGGRLAPLAAAASAVAEGAGVPVSVHLDHVTDPDLLRRCLGTGASSVMFDASTLDYADNVAATRDAARWAHESGLWLEAELGEVGGKDGAHAPGVRTDPRQAREFVEATEVDALAVAVGSSHAMTRRTAEIDLDLVTRLRDAVPVPLVLHGSSGVADDRIAAAVAAGVVKVNIGTILGVGFTRAVRTVLEDAEVVDPRRYLAAGRDAVADTVARLAAVVSDAEAADGVESP